MIKWGKIVAIALAPAALAVAGVDFGGQQNGANRPSWGRPAVNSWGQGNFIVNRSNALTGVVPLSLPTGSFDPIHGFGAENIGVNGLQMKGPGQTRVIFDRLVANTVVHVLGGDIDDQILSNEEPQELFHQFRPEISGGFVLGRNSETGSNPGLKLPPPPPVPTPEPASAALLGAALLLGLRRPDRKRA